MPFNMFDAQSYVEHNGDVAAAVARGKKEVDRHYIHPDSGSPVRSPIDSWRLMKRKEAWFYLRPEEPNLASWPLLAQRFVDDVVAAEIASFETPPKSSIVALAAF
jgi:hypothetical protein